MKPRLTEEFLWKLYKFLEALDDAHKTITPRSWRDAATPGWRKFRLTYEKKRRKKTFSQFVSYLRQQGYIKVPTGESIASLELTEKGKQKALEGKKKGNVLNARRDGKMIMLMYDIPKRKENVRKAFRSELELLDYQMFQKSVWVSDKDILKETERIVRGFDLHSHVKIFIIEKVRVQK